MDYKKNAEMQFTEWEPMSQMISSQKIKLVKTGNNCLKTKKSGNYLFIVFPMIILIFLFSILIITDTWADFGIKNYFGVTFFVVLFGTGLFLFNKFGFKTSIFDFDNRIYYFNDNDELPLDEIKGIQILTYHHTIPGNYKIKFEINLVKLNGERLHLYNNSKYQLIKRQAEILADKIGVEVWDATNEI